MKFPVWVIRILLSVLFLVPALYNTVEVSLVPPFGMVWHSPLILIVLAFFVVGILLATLAMAPRMTRHRFMAGRPRRQVGRTEKAEAVTEVPMPVVADSSYRAPGSKV